MGDAFQTPSDLIHPLHYGIGAFKRSPVGQLHNDEKIAHILSRNEAGRNRPEKLDGSSDETQIDKKHDEREPQEASHRPRIQG